MLKRKISQFFYKLLVKLKGEEWVTYYILKQDKTPTIKGLKEGIRILKKAGKKPKKNI